MIKAKVQVGLVQNWVAAVRNEGTSIQSPQSDSIARFEALAARSPQAQKLAQLKARLVNGPQAVNHQKLNAQASSGPSPSTQHRPVLDQGREVSAPLLRSASAGMLSPSQVRLTHRPRLALDPAGVVELASSTAGGGNPTARPIPDALRDGRAEATRDAVVMPGVSNAENASTLAASVRQMNPKATRLLLGPDGYDLQARLNPWVSVATGNYLHGLADPASPLANKTPHPVEARVIWTNYMLAPFNIGTFGHGPDSAWTPFGAMTAGMAAAAANPTPMEQQAAAMNGTIPVDTGFGPATASQGWGGQPRISSRLLDYSGARAPTDYPGLSGILGSAINPEELAYQMNEAAQGGAPNINLTDQQRRAAAMTVAITQIAEQHPRRTPGSAAMGRAALTAVADGVMTFEEAINAMPFAPTGGTQNMRNVVAGAAMDEDQEFLAGLMDQDEHGPLW